MSAQGWALLLDSLQKRKSMEADERERRRKAAADEAKAFQDDMDRWVDLQLKLEAQSISKATQDLAKEKFGYDKERDTVTDKQKADKEAADAKKDADKLATDRSDKTIGQVKDANAAFQGGSPLGVSRLLIGDPAAQNQFGAQQLATMMAGPNPRVAMNPMAGAQGALGALGMAGSQPTGIMAPLMQMLGGMAGDIGQQAAMKSSPKAEADQQAALLANQKAQQDVTSGLTKEQIDQIKLKQETIVLGTLEAREQAQLEYELSRNVGLNLDNAVKKVREQYADEYEQARLANMKANTARALRPPVSASDSPAKAEKQARTWYVQDRQLTKEAIAANTKLQEKARNAMAKAAMDRGFGVDFDQNVSPFGRFKRLPGVSEANITPEEKQAYTSQFFAAQQDLIDAYRSRVEIDQRWTSKYPQALSDPTFIPQKRLEVKPPKPAPVLRPGSRIQGGNVIVSNGGMAPAPTVIVKPGPAKPAPKPKSTAGVYVLRNGEIVKVE